ncbi:uncharacterized protein LOC143470023 [Clavelina lepadiformis]|uniref:uncharacterized protein LOC143470023 n=1 Tax=Clavelina lepadiformis TaxID=159417 RepID=UPI00404331F9
MKVIVAGHQKTGTKTLNEALTLLGYNVYDFLENFFYLSKEWNQILTTGGDTQLFQKMFCDVDAVCDMPSLLFWEEIHRAFPDAKIILSVRENDDVWFRSMMNQMTSNQKNCLLRLVFFLSPTALSRLVGSGIRAAQLAYGMDRSAIFSTKQNEMYMKLCYRRHNAHVMMNAPKDKLLIYNCKEGWGPLCEFLGVDAPSVPFPHKNKKGSIFDELMEKSDIMKRMQLEALVVGGIIIAIIVVIVSLCISLLG